MDNVNVLDQMAEYDFNSPIGVTMIFEDNIDDASFQNAMKEQKNMMDDNKNKEVSVENCESRCLKLSKKKQINNKCSNKPKLRLKNNNKVKQKKSLSEEISEKNAENILNNCQTYDNGYHQIQNTSNTNQDALIVIDGNTRNNEEHLPSIREVNDHEPNTTFIEDLLNKLSKHLILIMQAFYHYGCRRVVNNVQDNEERRKVFNFIKTHFFELSYTTVESVILPQEQHESFINTFLDNTARIANNTSLKWKCHRGHVRPFLKDLVGWTKQKRDYIKQHHLQDPSNENIILKQHLNRPLQPFSHPDSKSIPSSKNASLKAQNNLCIFSSGTPGNEISINIDANTLRNVKKRQVGTTEERNGNDNNYVPDSEFASRNTSIAGPPYKNHFNNIQNNNTTYYYNRPPPPYNQPPPPYNMNPHSRSFTMLQQNYQINENLTQSYHTTEPPYQNHQSQTAQPNQNYQTQVHYINTTQASPPENDNLNSLLHNNIDTNAPTHGTQFEKQITFSPVITNVTSYNPKTRIPVVRCSMCDKKISTLPAPYPCRPSYCSFLCKELDSQSYKPAWRNT